MSTTIYKKLLEVKKQVPYLKKDKKGFNYSYTNPSHVLATVNPILNELGLILITGVVESKSYEIKVPTKNDPNKIEWKYDLDFVFTWVDVENGERLDIPFKASGVNGEDKGLGSALTYAERYFILKQFNIPTDSDDPDSFQDKYMSEEDKKEKKQKEEAELREKNKPKPSAPATVIAEAKSILEKGEKLAAPLSTMYTLTAKDSESLSRSVYLGKWFIDIQKCDEKELSLLYKTNEKTVYADADIKELFRKRTEQLAIPA